MGIQPTFIDRSMSNERVLEIADAFMFGMQSLDEYEELKQKEGQHHRPKIEKLSDYIQNRALAPIGHIFRDSTADPIRKVIWTQKNPKMDQKDATLNTPKISG